MNKPGAELATLPTANIVPHRILVIAMQLHSFIKYLIVCFNLQQFLVVQ